MLDSGVQLLRQNIEELRNLQASLRSNGTLFESAIRLCDQIADELEGSNPTLAAGWRDAAGKLSIFNEQTGGKIENIYNYINNQIQGITASEQQQTQVVENFINEGDKLLEQLRSITGNVVTAVTDPSVTDGISTTTTNLANTIGNGVISTTSQLTPIVADGIVNTTNAAVPIVADGVTKATGLVTNGIADGLGRVSPRAGEFARTLGEGITDTTGQLAQVFSDGIISTTSQVTPILANQIVDLTSTAVPIVTNGFTTTTQNLLQAGRLAAQSSMNR